MNMNQYKKLLDQAPQIRASGLAGDYRTLAEFNGIVLAGHQTKYGMEFVTWEWVQNHTALWQGHYTNSYDTAKRDFVTRSGLLPPEQLFSDQQLAEVYRCVHETLESDYSITPEREKLLTGIVEQIEAAAPSLDALVQRSNEQETTQAPSDFPSMTQQF